MMKKLIKSFSRPAGFSAMEVNSSLEPPLKKVRFEVSNHFRTNDSASPASTSDEVMTSLTTIFGIKSFRGQQEHIVRSTLAGRDCLVVMPTGEGKSLCYQLPAALSDGVTVVVSPLKSLMYRSL